MRRISAVGGFIVRIRRFEFDIRTVCLLGEA